MYLSACAILGFFAFTLYFYNTACVSILGIFLGLIWIEYGFNNILSKKTTKTKIDIYYSFLSSKYVISQLSALTN